MGQVWAVQAGEGGGEAVPLARMRVRGSREHSGRASASCPQEAVIDLGCLVSSTLSVGSPDRCATIQSALGVSNTDYPDCWVAGWEAIFGVAPNAIGLSTYSGAAGTVAASECGATSGAPAAVGAGALRTALLAALAFAAVLMSRAQLLA